MKLGFVSAILPEYTLEQVLSFAREAGFSSVELMCWPPGKAERRYAGVTHLDVTDLSPDAIEKIQDLRRRSTRCRSRAWAITPTRCRPTAAEAEVAVAHLHKVIDAAAALGVGRGQLVRRPRPGAVGRRQLAAVPGDLAAAGRPRREQDVRIGIENCPMLFTQDEWPGGKNLATSPAIWRRMFADIPSPSFGLNFDPSHLIWQQMDYLAPLVEFRDRIFHVHAKDARIDRAALDEHGVLCLSQALAHAQDPRPGRRPLGRASSAPSPTPATTATSPSRSRTGRSRARSRRGSSR